MGGPACAVYGRGAIDEPLLQSIDRVLDEVASDLRRTRKGRVWDAHIEGLWVHVQAKPSSDWLWDCEDDLLAWGETDETLPTRVVLDVGVNDPAARGVLRNVARRLSAVLGGPFTEPDK